MRQTRRIEHQREPQGMRWPVIILFGLLTVTLGANAAMFYRMESLFDKRIDRVLSYVYDVEHKLDDTAGASDTEYAFEELKEYLQRELEEVKDLIEPQRVEDRRRLQAAIAKGVREAYQERARKARLAAMTPAQKEAKRKQEVAQAKVSKTAADRRRRCYALWRSERENRIPNAGSNYDRCMAGERTTPPLPTK